MTFTASKLTAARQIAIEAVGLPDTPPEGTARLKLAVGSLCGTDLHYYQHFENAGFKLRNPVTLGHEAAAWVEDPNGSDLTPGQLVAVNPIIACGACDNCRRGEVNLCTAKRFPGSATTVPHIDGFFREYFDFEARCCIPVGTEVRPEHLTFAEPLACAMHSVNKAGVKAGDRVMVTGAGPMGLLAVLGAAAKGAEVSCVDLRPIAVDLATRVGAKAGYVVGDFDPASLQGCFDAVIEASGALSAFDQGLGFVRRQGVVSILSNIRPSATQINLNQVMLKEITVVGSFQFNKEFAEAVAVIESGTFDFDALIARQFDIGDTAAALELMASGQTAGKIQIKGV